MQQSLEADAGHRATRIATQVLCAINIIFLQTLVDIVHQFFCLYLRKRKVDDALNAESQTQHQRQCYQRHKTSRALNELALQLLMQSTTLAFQFSLHALQVGINDSHGRISRKRVILNNLCGISFFGLSLCHHSLSECQQPHYCQ